MASPSAGVKFVVEDRQLGKPDVEAASHANMSLGLDTHLRRRGDIDRHLAHLSVEAEGLKAAIEGIVGRDSIRGSSRTEPAQVRELSLHSQLADEAALLDAQLDAAHRLSTDRQNEISDLKALLAERRGTALKFYGVSSFRAVLHEMSNVEERVRSKEDEWLELSKTAWNRRAAQSDRRQELEREGDALDAQRADLAQRVSELEQQLADCLAFNERLRQQQLQMQASAANSPGKRKISPTRGPGGQPTGADTSGGYLTAANVALGSTDATAAGGSASASDTEAMLRREIDMIKQDMQQIEESLARDGALMPDGSPRERLLNRELPPSGLTTDTLIRIMQLLKASLFNVSTDIGMIEATVGEIIRARDAADEPERWGRDLVGEALSSAARYVHQPYESDVAVAEKMAKKLRRLVLVCDTVDGLTAEWVVEYATRRGIGLEVSQFYEVAMECRAVILEARRRKLQISEQRRQMQQSATKGRVFASLGMRRASQARGSISMGRTPSQQPYFVDSDDGLGVSDAAAEE